MKKKIIIWGGNAKPLELKYLNSHASVNAFFLTKYLKNEFEVINITDIDKPEEILKYENIHSVLSTSQYGFTNRIIAKGKIEIFNKIKRKISGKLCSIGDDNNIRKYYEDIIFCVRKINSNNLIKSRKISFNKDLKVFRSGWCADPSLFYPENNNDEFNIFIDHAPYGNSDNGFLSSLIDYKAVERYHLILSELVKDFPSKNINVYHQNNFGIVKWDFRNDLDLRKMYDRSIKIPYIDLAKIYRKIHIFCCTHKESAGLGAIEAAMCGAKIYILTDYFNRSFLKKDLLNDNLNYKILYPINQLIKIQFKKDLKKGINKNENHEKLKFSSNTWKSASEVIAKAINNDD